MAKTNITHKCGHDAIHQLVGPGRDRERKRAWLEGTLCWDCHCAEREAARRAATEAAAVKAVEYEMPELRGTEKQVAWALTIRQEFIDRIGDDRYHSDVLETLCSAVPARRTTEVERLRQSGAASGFSGSDARLRLIKALRPALLDWAGDITDAHAWIDMGRGVMSIVSVAGVDLADQVWAATAAIVGGEEPEAAMYAARADSKARAAAEKADADSRRHLEAQALAEATLRPETPSTRLVAKITVADGKVTLSFPERDNNVYAVMSGLKFEWIGGTWKRSLVGDIVIETACRLLAKGVAVMLQDPDMRRRVVATDYKAFNARRILATTGGSFVVTWPRETDYFDRAKRIHGARWNKASHGMVVPADSYEEVLDFAEVHDFAITVGARELVDKQKAVIDASLSVSVTVPEPEPPPAEWLAIPLPIPVPDHVEIPAHLLDTGDID